MAPDPVTAIALGKLVSYAVDQGDVAQAHSLLRHVANLEVAAAKALAAQTEVKQRSAADLLTTSAETAHLNLDYLAAAQDFADAADLLASFDSEQAGSLRLRRASALYDQGNEFGDNGALAHAIDAYRVALLERTRACVPLDWAATQNNLGNALLTLGKREPGNVRLEEAVEAYRAALLEYTHERTPVQWATTQNNLGAALEELGRREPCTERLEEAVAAYSSALLERVRERMPMEWAGTQNNLGNALGMLGERQPGTASLTDAISAFRAALAERTRKRVVGQFEI